MDRRLVPSKRLDGDGSNQAKPKAFVGTRDAKGRKLGIWSGLSDVVRGGVGEYGCHLS